ncbi:MAG TPA: NAD(P)-dependent oxidoreductase [Bryobacteraceae bacterium]|nr:NAD(P)-dependent oxidoreductase [Bryobacteraceae bacterium]
MSAIASETELDDLLSAPCEGDVAALRAMEGDLLILGAGGKMGPSLARRARRAADQSGAAKRIVAVSRFSDAEAERQLREAGVETICADLLDFDHPAALPDASHVIFMAGRKFGSTGAAHLTWASNVYLPARLAERYRASKVVAFSSGNVYPLVAVSSRGATEDTVPDPAGEYAQSVLARERMFEFFSDRHGTHVCLLRLNYAVELRYGVLRDIGLRVFEGRPVDVRMGRVNVIWQGDANSVCLRSFAICSSPPTVLNVTGPETLSVRDVALRFGELFGRAPVFEGQESDTALLNNAARSHAMFGTPSVSAETAIEWTAEWIRAGQAGWDKPTHFETRDGRF